ncbi:MAG: hypothetical protein EB121_04075, partial [Alphaproteobacteria bacterium]|nr:hypothetical protein [Alphaproteobacteria bacterium]
KENKRASIEARIKKSNAYFFETMNSLIILKLTSPEGRPFRPAVVWGEVVWQQLRPWQGGAVSGRRRLMCQDLEVSCS